MRYSDVIRNLGRMIDDQDCSSCALQDECGADVDCWFLQIKAFVKTTCCPAGEWISPLERMPKVGERVIIAREYENGAPLRVEQAVYTGANEWWKVFGANVKTRRVVGWMPMPAPPEEEQA